MGHDVGVEIRKALKEIQKMIGAVDPNLVAKLANLIMEADVIVLFGNGGSYANATHFACDLNLRTKVADRVVCIGDNTSLHTAYVNDTSYEEAVAEEMTRYLAPYNSGAAMVVILFSTSGESKNIVRAAKVAKELGAQVVAMFGEHLNRIEPYADLVISIKGRKSSRIEAAHDAICHAVADAVHTKEKAE